MTYGSNVTEIGRVIWGAAIIGFMSPALAAGASDPIVILNHTDCTIDTAIVLRELVEQGRRRPPTCCFSIPNLQTACIAAGVGSIEPFIEILCRIPRGLPRG